MSKDSRNKFLRDMKLNGERNSDKSEEMQHKGERNQDKSVQQIQDKEESNPDKSVETMGEELVGLVNSAPSYDDAELAKFYKVPPEDIITNDQIPNLKRFNRKKALGKMIDKYGESTGEEESIGEEGNKGAEIIKFSDFIKTNSQKSTESKNLERSTANKPILRRPEKKQPKHRFTGRIIAWIMAGIAATTSSIGIGINIANQGETISISDAAYSLGQNPDSLGITEDMFKKLQYLESVSREKEIPNDELITLAPVVYELGNSVIKSKLANLLRVNSDDIKLDIENGEGCTKRKVVSVYKNGMKHKYYNNELGRTRNILPDEISELIYKVEDLKNENIYKMIDKISRFAAMGLNIDKKGIITTEKIYVSDIPRVAEEKGHTQETKEQIKKRFNTSQGVYSANANGDVSQNTDTINLEYDDDGR